MAAWCLPRDLSAAFLDKIRDGTFSPRALMDMSSEERRAAFAEVVGDENAKEINAQFEQTLLLKDQQRGMVTWANRVAGIKEAARRDILTQINKLNRVLQPEDEQSFLADLAEKRLGVQVTADEARQIFDLSQKATTTLEEITGAPGRGKTSPEYRAATRDDWTRYGAAELALIDKINSLKPGGQSFPQAVQNVLAVTRQLETGIMHFSAPGVQAYGMVSTKQFWTGIGRMFQFFATKDAYADFQAYMFGHPDYEFAKGGGLGLTKLGDRLSSREEEIQSSILENVNQFVSDHTGVPNLIKGWSQAFTGYLNYVRFERFLDILNSARLAGEDIRPESEATHDIAQVVNNFTGRAEMGYRDKYGNIAAPANMLLYTVRKNVATFQMFNPWEYVKPNMSRTARFAAARQMTGMILFTGGVVGLAAAMGVRVSMDPRSSDFLKIPVGGGAKLDLGGANATYLRFLARLLTNEEVTPDGQVKALNTPGAPTSKELIGQFVLGKLAPNAAFIADALVTHQTFGKRGFDLQQELYDRLTPIWIHQMIDYWTSAPDVSTAVIPSLAAMFGIGLEVPTPLSESGRDVWGDQLPPVGVSKSYRDDPVNQALDQIGYRMNFPQQKIRGEPLTPDQFDDYSRVSGRLAHMRLREIIGSPIWTQSSTAGKTALVRNVVRQSREIAATQIMIRSQGGPNDIVKAAYEAKRAQQSALAATP